MKLVLILVVFISTVKSTPFPSGDCINTLHNIEGHRVVCQEPNGATKITGETIITLDPVTLSNINLATETLAVYGEFTKLGIGAHYDWLKKLYIHSTKLETFNFQDFENVAPNIEDIFITNSKKLLHINLDNNHTSLFRLSIFDNEEVNIDCDSFKASSVKRIDLTSNKRTISSKNSNNFDFSCLPSGVESIELGNNDLTTINTEQMVSMTNLERLDLAGNSLSDFDVAHLPPSLKKLNLDNNNITTLNTTELTNLVHLEQIDLAGNSLNLSPSQLNDLKTTNAVTLTCDCKLVEMVINNGFTNVKNTSCTGALKQYPWSQGATKMRDHDKVAANCLLATASGGAVAGGAAAVGGSTAAGGGGAAAGGAAAGGGADAGDYKADESDYFNDESGSNHVVMNTYVIVVACVQFIATLF